MTSSRNHDEAFVWIWLPNETEPIVAGKLVTDHGNIRFNYGKSYLECIHDTPAAIPIYEPELPLKSGILPLLEGLSLPGCIRDAAPDAWGRRVIINRKLGLKGANTDDHARNHAAFWDGNELSLTPAYDICPQGRAGNIASQAMPISGNKNLSQLKNCLETAHHFLLSEDDARNIIEKQKTVIENYWDLVCDEAEISEVDKNHLWGRQFLNPYSFE